MTELSGLKTLFTGKIEHRNGAAVVVIPDEEIDFGTLAVGETYRIGVAEHSTDGARDSSLTASGGPPVEVGERRTVDIEDVGEQGDGIARVGPGYIVFVENTAVGDRVEIEVSEVRENFAFARLIDDEEAPT